MTTCVNSLGHVGSEPLVACLDALFRQDAETALHTVGRLQMEGYEAGGIMKALLEGLRHLIVLKTVPQPEHLIPLAESDLTALRRVADAVSTEEIYGQFHTLSAAEGSLRYAGNPMLVLGKWRWCAWPASVGCSRWQSVLDYLQQVGDGQAPAPSAAPYSVAVAAPEPAANAVYEAPPAESTITDEHEVPPSSEGDPWHRLQERVAQKRPSLAGCLAQGTVVSNQDNKLAVGIHDATRSIWRHCATLTTSPPSGKSPRTSSGRISRSLSNLWRTKRRPPLRPLTPPQPTLTSPPWRTCSRANSPSSKPSWIFFKPYLNEEQTMKGVWVTCSSRPRQMQQKMAKLQEELAQRTVEASVGGGMVSVTVNGRNEVLRLKIEPQVVDPDDIEMLEDLVLAGVNEALRKSQEMISGRDEQADRRDENSRSLLSRCQGIRHVSTAYALHPGGRALPSARRR